MKHFLHQGTPDKYRRSLAQAIDPVYLSIHRVLVNNHRAMLVGGR